jgi:hypothetical protein
MTMRVPCHLLSGCPRNFSLSKQLADYQKAENIFKIALKSIYKNLLTHKLLQNLTKTKFLSVSFYDFYLLNNKKRSNALISCSFLDLDIIKELHLQPTKACYVIYFLIFPSKKTEDYHMKI